ncbi:hypothetical protein EJ03DRAFT_146032 [Teratosphaeria nubilosa]|uniref:Uncharacterized protein n=1 Tax=Teratosphaeria nubilosa TaxID=161662 RepID=A0A6G1L469_9PEZI|nr:hypothetical protein EJ03DRAFT_146032 [Teratosphaeria nubilosa]
MRHLMNGSTGSCAPATVPPPTATPAATSASMLHSGEDELRPRSLDVQRVCSSGKWKSLYEARIETSQRSWVRPMITAGATGRYDQRQIVPSSTLVLPFGTARHMAAFVWTQVVVSLASHMKQNPDRQDEVLGGTDGSDEARRSSDLSATSVQK